MEECSLKDMPRALETAYASGMAVVIKLEPHSAKTLANVLRRDEERLKADLDGLRAKLEKEQIKMRNKERAKNWLLAFVALVVVCGVLVAAGIL